MASLEELGAGETVAQGQGLSRCRVTPPADPTLKLAGAAEVIWRGGIRSTTPAQSTGYSAPELVGARRTRRGDRGGSYRVSTTSLLPPSLEAASPGARAGCAAVFLPRCHGAGWSLVASLAELVPVPRAARCLKRCTAKYPYSGSMAVRHLYITVGSKSKVRGARCQCPIVRFVA